MPTFERSNLELFYDEHGSGAPVVLHTGGGGDSRMFGPAGYVDALVADGYRVICYDHRGHGRSDSPARRRDHATIEYVEDLVALLDHVGEPSCAIVGYSQGMAIAVTFAATHPERVGALVGIGAVGAVGESMEWRSGAAAQVREHGMAASIDEMATAEHEPAPAWLLENLSSTESETFALLIEAPLDDERELWDHFGQVRAPALLVVGEHEEDEEEHQPAGVAGRNARAAAALIPNGRAEEVPGLAHLAAFWRTDLTLPLIRRFLAETYPAAGGPGQ